MVNCEHVRHVLYPSSRDLLGGRLPHVSKTELEINRGVSAETKRRPSVTFDIPLT